MKTDKIKFGKMLKLIVASEFPKSKNWSFTTMAILPILVLLFIPISIAIKDRQTSSFAIVALFVIVIIISQFTLKRYAKKWKKENTHALDRYKKKIFHHFLIYMLIYWGITIGCVSILAVLDIKNDF